MRHVHAALAASCLGLALVACSADDGDSDTSPIAADDDGDDGDDGEVDDDAPEEAPDEDEPDVDDAPSAQDVDGTELGDEDVERIISELYARDSELVREIIANGPGEVPIDEVPIEEYAERIASIYQGPALGSQGAGLQGLVATEEGRAGLLPAEEYGDARFEVDAIYTATGDCVTAIGWLDTTETATDPLGRDELGAVTIRQVEDPTVASASGWHIWETRILTRGGEGVPLDEILADDLSEVVDTCEEDAT